MPAISENLAVQLELDLRELVASIRNDYLRKLLGEFFAVDSATWARYRDAPAAKRHHQAYAHGLLEHSLTVAQAVDAMALIFGGVDRDLAVTGALLHDLGKLEAYAHSAGSIELTDLGRLHGEIALGFYRVKQAIERIEGFPPSLEQELLHIILSHHGQREYGSPVVPCTREAALVHAADDIGAKLGSFDRIEESLDANTNWSSFDRALGCAAYFGAGETRPPEAEPRFEISSEGPDIAADITAAKAVRAVA